ncbi:MAG: hypothetical protein SNJ56_02570 [Termitinemataceae bacterium]
MKPASSILITSLICILMEASLAAEPLYSPTWGFSLDLPTGYTYTGGDGINRFSFSFEDRGPARCDIRIYNSGEYKTLDDLAQDITRRLGSSGDISRFQYRQKEAALIELSFSLNRKQQSGWGLCVQLDVVQNSKQPPMMVVLAYGDADISILHNFHLSILDSVSPSPRDRLAPGPISSFSFPKTTQVQKPIAFTSRTVLLDMDAAEACRATIDREFALLKNYSKDVLWQDAWIRFYRAIYKGSFEPLGPIAFELERYINANQQVGSDSKEQHARTYAEKLLSWIQNFHYERDLIGTDFVDLITAATEGRGDCDSRALLYAILLQYNNIQSAIMVSREYSHAMGLVLLDGQGARFITEQYGQSRSWLVAETTAQVPLGLIGRSVADPAKWLAVLFE